MSSETVLVCYELDGFFVMSSLEPDVVLRRLFVSERVFFCVNAFLEVKVFWWVPIDGLRAELDDSVVCGLGGSPLCPARALLNRAS